MLTHNIPCASYWPIWLLGEEKKGGLMQYASRLLTRPLVIYWDPSMHHTPAFNSQLKLVNFNEERRKRMHSCMWHTCKAGQGGLEAGP